MSLEKETFPFCLLALLSLLLFASPSDSAGQAVFGEVAPDSTALGPIASVLLTPIEAEVDVGLSPVERLRFAVVDTARGYLGVREVPMGSNEGPQVNKFLREGCGLGPGYAWCSCFVSYVFDQNDVTKPDFRTALSVEWMEKARERNLVRAKDLSRGIAVAPRGSVGAYKKGSTRSGHTVLTRGEWSGRCGPTIEGNYNDAVGENVRCARRGKYFHLLGLYITQ